MDNALEKQLKSLLGEIQSMRVEMEDMRAIIGRTSTLINYNYGDKGATFIGIIDEKDPLPVQVETVLRHYHNKLKEKL